MSTVLKDKNSRAQNSSFKKLLFVLTGIFGFCFAVFTTANAFYSCGTAQFRSAPAGRYLSSMFGTTVQENIYNGMWNYGAALSLIMLLLIGIMSLFTNEEDNAQNESGGVI